MRLQGVKGRNPEGSGHAVADRRTQYGGMNPRGVLAETWYGTVIPKRWTGDEPARSRSSEVRMPPTVDWIRKIECSFQ